MSRTTAVRVSCNGEVEKFVKKFEAYNILPEHDIYTHGELSQVSVLLGVPLLLMKLRPSLLENRPRARQQTKSGVRYGYTQEGDFFPNTTAMYLMGGNADTAHLWNDRTGSILIARQDGKPLPIAHISVLVDFLNFAFQYAQKENTPAPFQEHVFKNYYNDVVQKTAQRDAQHELVTLPSPFEGETRRDSVMT